MLSFLREQEVLDTSERQVPRAARANHAKDAQEQEYFTVAAKSKNVHRSTVLLAVLFGMGLLCLCFMIKKSTPKTASADIDNAEESRIEMAITQLTGIRAEMYDRMDEIVGKFYEFSDVLQVQVDELLKNPFELEKFLASLKSKLGDNEKFDIDAEMLLQQQLSQQAKGMRLLCIMQSEQGRCCMIDDQILYEGGSIKDFKITRIGDASVDLESEDMKIVLKLTE